MIKISVVAPVFSLQQTVVQPIECVLAQPVPVWLLHSDLKRYGRVREPDTGLRLIYPAAGYLYKYHALLSRLDLRAICPASRADDANASCRCTPRTASALGAMPRFFVAPRHD